MSKPTHIKSTYKVVKAVADGGAGHRGPENLRMVQNYSYDQIHGAEHFYEIGDEQIVSTAYDPLSTDISLDFNLSNQSFANLCKICNVHGRDYINQSDFENAHVDLIVPQTDDGSTLKSSVLLPYAFFTGMDMNFSVDGVATEAIRFTGGMDEEFLNDYKNLDGERLVSGTYGGANTVFTTEESATDKTVHYLYVDGQKYTTGFTWSTNTLTVTDLDVSDADHVALFWSSTGSTYTMITPETDDIGGFKGPQCELRLAYGSDPVAGDKWLRAQTASISIPLDRDELRELGTEQPIGRSLNYPLNITVTVDLLESDLEEYANEFAGQTFSTVDILNPKMFESRDDIRMFVIIKDPVDSSERYAIAVTNMRVDGHGVRMAVRDKGTVSWNFTADSIQFAAESANFA